MVDSRRKIMQRTIEWQQVMTQLVCPMTMECPKFLRGASCAKSWKLLQNCISEGRDFRGAPDPKTTTSWKPHCNHRSQMQSIEYWDEKGKTLRWFEHLSEGVHFLNYWRSTNQRQTQVALLLHMCTVLRLHIRQRPHGSYPTIVSVVAVRSRPEAQPDKAGQHIKHHDFITSFHCGMLCLPNSVWLLYAARLLLENWASQRNRNNRASINKWHNVTII